MFKVCMSIVYTSSKQPKKLNTILYLNVRTYKEFSKKKHISLLPNKNRPNSQLYIPQNTYTISLK